MAKGYHHLTYSQRCQIFILKDRKESNAEIARALEVHRSTIGRELKRNRGEAHYHYEETERKAKERTSTSSKIPLEVITKAEEKLHLQWSPEQISGWMKKEKLGKTNYETIYKHV